ncbi:MAG: porin family protein [Alysiella sp.]|uniref:porin family protein n=1 Tax=Alysiella sp. TaxID=1872483 RepID=UPI0026DCB1E0|nr:porin family protein [Alysiella sp.]MDO4433038.1 porin family protein [Alysiella sp.]
MNHKTLSALLLLMSFPVTANNEKSPDDHRLADEQVHQQIQSTLPKQPEKKVIPPETTSEQSIALSETELQQHPDLIVRAIMAALLQGNGENTAILLPHYQRLPENLREPALDTWAQALVARWQGNHGQAVRLYRQVLAEKPDWSVLRLQTAAALLSNKEWEAAEDQFRKVQSENQLPPQLANEIEQVVAHIKQLSHWQFSGSTTFINDKNINNAPQNPDLGGGWRGEEAQSGQGFAINFSATKKWFWQNALFHELRLDSSSKYYWNNKRFNEANIRTSLGIGYQNAKNSLTLLPFFEQMWYAGGSKNDSTLQRFSQGRGIALEASHTFNPKWQGNLYAETIQNRYRTRKHLNGNAHFVSLTASYQHNPKQAWFAGIDFNRSNAHDADDSFIRKGIRTGWLQEWSKGLATRISVSYGRKTYRAAGFFNRVQANHEWGAQASIWHRALHWQGLTPRLTWSYNKNRSNIKLYNYDKHRVFLEISKQF